MEFISQHYNRSTVYDGIFILASIVGAKHLSAFYADKLIFNANLCLLLKNAMSTYNLFYLFRAFLSHLSPQGNPRPPQRPKFGGNLNKRYTEIKVKYLKSH